MEKIGILSLVLLTILCVQSVEGEVKNMAIYNEQPLIIFITGASGSGKTTILKAFEQYYSPGTIEIHHFDDIGVPGFEEMVALYGSGEKWQEWATHAWVEKMSESSSKKFVLLEGSFNPEFAVTKMQELGLKKYVFICLHTERAVREKRLIADRMQPELATQDMENFAQFLASKTRELGGIVIDTSVSTISEVMQQIVELIKKS